MSIKRLQQMPHSASLSVTSTALQNKIDIARKRVPIP